MKVLSTVASVIALGTRAVDGLKMNNAPAVDKKLKIGSSGLDPSQLPDVPGSPSSTKPSTRITVQQSPQPVDAEEFDVKPEMELTPLVASNRRDLAPIVQRVKCSWATDSHADAPGASYPNIVLSEKQWRSGYLLGVKLDGHASVLFDDTKTVADIWVNRCFHSRHREAVRIRSEIPDKQADLMSTDGNSIRGGVNGGLVPIMEDGELVAGTPDAASLRRSDSVGSTSTWSSWATGFTTASERVAYEWIWG